MTVAAGTRNYVTGVEYTYTLGGPELEPGSYKVVFEATDDSGEDAVPYPTGDQAPITFTVSDGDNIPPVLAALSVISSTGKTAGKLNDTFKYKATYSDAEVPRRKGKPRGSLGMARRMS